MVVISKKSELTTLTLIPATVDLDIDAAVKWLENGAQPTDTARTLLSYQRRFIEAPPAGWSS